VKPPTMPLPDVTEFTGRAETLVRVLPGEHSGADTVRLISYWLNNDPAGPPVRGQVFHTSISQFTAREQAAGITVRIIE